MPLLVPSFCHIRLSRTGTLEWWYQKNLQGVHPSNHTLSATWHQHLPCDTRSRVPTEVYSEMKILQKPTISINQNQANFCKVLASISTRDATFL